MKLFTMSKEISLGLGGKALFHFASLSISFSISEMSLWDQGGIDISAPI